MIKMMINRLMPPSFLRPSCMPSSMPL
jgi:hypothetical protein